MKPGGVILGIKPPPFISARRANSVASVGPVGVQSIKQRQRRHRLEPIFEMPAANANREGKNMGSQGLIYPPF
jgi:hypothetical protein